MRFELDHDRRNISNQDLLSDLSRVAESKSQRQLKQRTYKEFGKFGVTTVIRRFGSWNAAIEAAGLEVVVERNIPDSALFQALYDLWVSLGRQPTYAEAQGPASRFNVSTYERRFGSWRRALESFVEYANTRDLPAIVPASIDARSQRNRSMRSPDLRLRFRILQRDNFRCFSCGASPTLNPGVRLDVDHVQHWSRGGETKLDNLQTLCSGCNQGKSNLT